MYVENFGFLLYAHVLVIIAIEEDGKIAGHSKNEPRRQKTCFLHIFENKGADHQRLC